MCMRRRVGCLGEELLSSDGSEEAREQREGEEHDPGGEESDRRDQRGYGPSKTAQNKPPCVNHQWRRQKES